jgi:hypothetical protein
MQRYSKRHTAYSMVIDRMKGIIIND